MLEAIFEFMKEGVDGKPVQYLIDEWKISEDNSEGYIKLEGTKKLKHAEASQIITFRGLSNVSIQELMNIGVKKALITLDITDQNLFELSIGGLVFFKGKAMEVHSKAHFRR